MIGIKSIIAPIGDLPVFVLVTCAIMIYVILVQFRRTDDMSQADVRNMFLRWCRPIALVMASVYFSGWTYVDEWDIHSIEFAVSVITMFVSTSTLFMLLVLGTWKKPLECLDKNATQKINQRISKYIAGTPIRTSPMAGMCSQSYSSHSGSEVQMMHVCP